jgi:hypothetical protein
MSSETTYEYHYKGAQNTQCPVRGINKLATLENTFNKNGHTFYDPRAKKGAKK